MKYIILITSFFLAWTNVNAQLIDDVASGASCVKMQVAISSTLLKMASNENYYTISYCNHGSAEASNTFIELDLDSDLTIISCEKPMLLLSDNIYKLEVGSVEGGLCGSFDFQVGIKSTARTNQVHCTTAKVVYDNLTCNSSNANAGAVTAQQLSQGRVIMGLGIPITPPTSSVFEDNVMLNQTPLDLDTLLVIAASLSTDVGAVINTIEQGQHDNAISTVTNYSIASMVDASHCVFNIGNYQVSPVNPNITSTESVEEKEIKLSIYPNPVTTSTTIQVELLTSDNLVFELIDLTGRVLQQIPMNTPSIRLERGATAAGVYLYRLRDAKAILKQGKLIMR